jgi:hypothetical protein
MKNKKTQKILCAILIAVFAVGMFLTGYSASKLAFEKHIKRTFVHDYAVVSHLEENSAGGDDYIISFNVEGNRYEKVYGNADSKTYIGETLDLYYEQGNPENYYIFSGNLNKWLLAEGIILALAALIILAVILIPVIVKHKLIRGNKWAMCKVIKLKKDGKRTVRICCDSSKFKSRKGKPFVSASVKKSALPGNIKESSLTVYYSEKNPNIYFVDTDKLS